MVLNLFNRLFHKTHIWAFWLGVWNNCIMINKVFVLMLSNYIATNPSGPNAYPMQ